jgi:hypothetical protein
MHMPRTDPAMAAQNDVKEEGNSRRFAFRPRLGRLAVPKSELLNHISTVLAYITM